MSSGAGAPGRTPGSAQPGLPDRWVRGAAGKAPGASWCFGRAFPRRGSREPGNVALCFGPLSVLTSLTQDFPGSWWRRPKKGSVKNLFFRRERDLKSNRRRREGAGTGQCRLFPSSKVQGKNPKWPTHQMGPIPPQVACKLYSSPAPPPSPGSLGENQRARRSPAGAKCGHVGREPAPPAQLGRTCRWNRRRRSA